MIIVSSLCENDFFMNNINELYINDSGNAIENSKNKMKFKILYNPMKIKICHYELLAIFDVNPIKKGKSQRDIK